MSTSPNTTVAIHTDLGDIHIEIFEAAAPIGSKNFLAYVDQGLLSFASFYRTVRREHWTPGRELSLIQGGLAIGGMKGLPPIPHESGLQTGQRHLRGSVSYARLEPGTAGSEFFICIEDCPGLDPTPNPVPPADGLGYAVFGKVVAGMDVVEAIQRSPTSDEAPIELLRGQIISEPMRVLGASRIKVAGFGFPA